MPAIKPVKSLSKAQKAFALQNGGSGSLEESSSWGETVGYTIASKEIMWGMIALPILTYGATPILHKELAAEHLPQVNAPCP